MSQFNIADFPTEILEKIFLHFDDTTNTIAAGVCKRFSEVLNETVCRKYNGSSRYKWYEVEIFNSSVENELYEMLQHQPFILRRVSAMKLIFHTDLNNRDHWIFRVISRIGGNIEKIHLTTPKVDDAITCDLHKILSKTPNISDLCVDYVYPINRKWCQVKYRQLTNFGMKLRVYQFDDNQLKSFVKNNCQLKFVKLELLDFRLLYAFDESNIVSMHCRFSHTGGNEVPVNVKPVRMTNLKSINLEIPKNSLNECIEKIIAPCQNLKDLCLAYFDNGTDNLNDQSMDILCSLHSLESFEPCFSDTSLEHIVRLIANLPKLVSISLWFTKFPIGNYRVLLEVANKHPSLRHILFRNPMMDIYEHSLLTWLIENISSRIQMEHCMCYKLTTTKGKVQYDGVTIVSSNGSQVGHEKLTERWLQGILMMACMNDQCFEFFSNLPIPQVLALFDKTENSDLLLNDETNEESVMRRGTTITKASTTLSSNYQKSVNHINWLEKYCRRLRDLTIYIEDNHPNLPAWTLPELNILRINCRQNHHSFDLSLFAAFTCLRLNCLKFVGGYPIMLTSLQVVHDIDLFDNLVTLQIFHFNESMDNLLDRLNQNVQRNLRYLTLANRRVERYRMTNKTITAVSRFTNLSQLKLILPGINETNTKYLFEKCTKLTDLYLECNFLTNGEHNYYSYGSFHMLDDIKSNCTALKRLQLVWYDLMMDPSKVSGIKYTFPNVFVKIMQVNRHMTTTGELIIRGSDHRFERLFDEIEV